MGSEADASAKQTFERATKETFVETMLHRVADGLASDAPYGYNSANQIRGRVEEIADQSDTSAGRKVLEARFAMGADDSQYLSQAVSLLWAGDGGERLRVVPAAMMPEVMRHASAEGIVLAMRRVMQEKKGENVERAKRGLEFAAWLLQVSEILAAVHDILTADWQPKVVRQSAAKLREAYAESSKVGAAYVERVLEGDTEREEYADRLAVAEALLMALHLLCANDCAPMQTVAHHQKNVAALVRRAALDSAAVVGMADAGLLGVKNSVRLAQGDTLRAAATRAAAGPAAFCTVYDANGLPQQRPQLNPPEPTVFQSAVMASFRRVAGLQTTPALDPGDSNVATRAETRNGDHTAPDSRRWKLDRVVSPLYNQGPMSSFYGGFWENENRWTKREQEVTEPRKDWGQGDVSSEMYAALGTTMSTRRPIDALQPLRADRLEPDSLFVDFCMARGLCGFSGPHQQLTPEAAAERTPTGENVHPPLDYNYPTEVMTNYTMGKMMRANDAPVSGEVVAAAKGAQERLYESVGALVASLNDDFVGDVVPMRAEHGVARPALWAPVPKQALDPPELALEDEVAVEACAAATYEFMAASFKKNAEAAEDALADGARVRLFRAAAAAAKIVQLSAMTTVHSQLADATFMRFANESLDAAYVVRPVERCDAVNRLRDAVRLPVDLGLARFVRLQNENKDGPRNSHEWLRISGEAPTRSNVPSYDPADPAVEASTQVENAAVTSWLQAGVQEGWGNHASVWSLQRSFGLYFGAAADASPVDTRPVDRVVQERTHAAASHMAAADLEIENVQNAVAHALAAVRELELVEHEDAYIQKLLTKGSVEQQGVFGIKAAIGNIEDASRDRRQAVWSDALREVAVSGDRLYRFVTQLTGAIGESADSAISWEDEDLKQMAKEANARQKALAERVARFQTKLVESVVSSTLKASNLQLEVRGGSSRDGRDGELVVLSGEVKDNLRQVMAGEGGHGLFEANVELNDLLGTAARPMHIGQIVNKLQAVSQEYHDQVARGITPSAPASYARLVEPRNSFMMHLKPDTSNAIQRAFDYITAEMRHCDGHHRHIHLWEFIEGRDWTLVTRFAELVGLMLQNTRMRSGSFAAYVGNAQLITNTQNVRTQLQRLRSQVCMYLSMQHSAPLFLHEHGRTYYFGGSVQPTTKADAARGERAAKKAKLGDASPFDAHPRDDGGDPTNKASRKAMRRKLLARLKRMARERRRTAEPPSRGSMSAEAAARWAHAGSPSDAGSVDNATSLHWHARDVLRRLLSENDDADADADAAAPFRVASDATLELRVRVLLQLRLTVTEGGAAQEAAPLRLPSQLSHDLHRRLKAHLTSAGPVSYSVLDSDASQGQRLQLPEDRGSREVIAGVPRRFVEIPDSVLDDGLLESSLFQEYMLGDAVRNSHVAVALNAVFGLPFTTGTVTNVAEEYVPGDDPLQWTKVESEGSGRWVREIGPNDAEFQQQTIRWHKEAVDFSATHKIPVHALLSAWCAELMIVVSRNEDATRQLTNAASAVCDAASFQANAYMREYVIREALTQWQRADRLNALVFSFLMEQNSLRIGEVRQACIDGIVSAAQGWLNQDAGQNLLSSSELITDAAAANKLKEEIADEIPEVAHLLEKSDDTFTPYALLMRASVAQPRRVLRRILEHVCGDDMQPMREKYLRSLGPSGDGVLTTEAASPTAMRLLTSLAARLDAPEQRAPKADGPTTTLEDWLERRIRAEQQPYEQIALVAVQTNSLRGLGWGTDAYKAVLRQVARYNGQAREEREKSREFLRKHGTAMFDAIHDYLFTPLKRAERTRAFKDAVQTAGQEMLLDLRDAMRDFRLVATADRKEKYDAKGEPVVVLYS